MILDRAGDEDDPLAQQPRKNVEAALAPVGLLDDDGDELRNDVLVVNHGRLILNVGPAYIGRNDSMFKRPAQGKGGPVPRTAPPFLALPLVAALAPFHRRRWRWRWRRRWRR